MSAAAAGTLLLTAVGLFSQLVGFFYRVALSRMLGAEAMGLYQLIMPVYSTLMSLSAVGLTVAVSTLAARLHAQGDDGAVSSMLRRALGCFFLVAVPLGLAAAALSDPISVYLLGDARTRLGVVLLVPCMLLTGVENLHKHCFYGLERVGPPALCEAVEQVLRAGAVLILLAVLRPAGGEGRVGAVAAGMVLCEVFSAVTLTLLLRRHWRREPPGPARSRTAYRQIVRIAVPVGLTSLLGTVLGSANAVLIPARLVAGGMDGAAAMSAFGVLCGMAMPLLAMPTVAVGALCLTMVPDLAKRTARGDLRAAGHFLDRVLGASSAVLAPAMTLLAVLGPAIGRAVYREPSVGDWMPALAAGTLLACWQSILSGALNALNRQRRAALGAIVSDAVQLAFTALTVARWGQGGFVVGFVLSGLVGAGMDLSAVLGCTGLRPRWYHWLVRPLLSAALMGLCSRLLFGLLERAAFGSLWRCLICAALGLAVYAAAMLAQGASPGDYLPRLRRRGDAPC